MFQKGVVTMQGKTTASQNSQTHHPMRSDMFACAHASATTRMLTPKTRLFSVQTAAQSGQASQEDKRVFVWLCVAVREVLQGVAFTHGFWREACCVY